MKIPLRRSLTCTLKMTKTLAMIYKQLPNSNLVCIWRASVHEQKPAGVADRALQYDCMVHACSHGGGEQRCQYLLWVLWADPPPTQTQVCTLLTFLECSELRKGNKLIKQIVPHATKTLSIYLSFYYKLSHIYTIC